MNPPWAWCAHCWTHQNYVLVDSKWLCTNCNLEYGKPDPNPHRIVSFIPDSEPDDSVHETELAADPEIET